MKRLLKAYETLSIVFMFGFLALMLLALSEGSMDHAVQFMVISFVFIMTTSWTHSATYINWKNKKGYEKI
jgi:uncharacterized membrane protein YjjP (DUF1212 family)